MSDCLTVTAFVDGRFLEPTVILSRWLRISIFEEEEEEDDGGGFFGPFERPRSPRGMRRKLDKEYFRIKNKKFSFVYQAQPDFHVR